MWSNGDDSGAPKASRFSSYRSLPGELMLVDARNVYHDTQRLWAEGGGPPI
jgi:hypothetical protein